MIWDQTTLYMPNQVELSSITQNREMRLRHFPVSFKNKYLPLGKIISSCLQLRQQSCLPVFQGLRPFQNERS